VGLIREGKGGKGGQICVLAARCSESFTIMDYGVAKRKRRARSKQATNAILKRVSNDQIKSEGFFSVSPTTPVLVITIIQF